MRPIRSATRLGAVVGLLLAMVACGGGGGGGGGGAPDTAAVGNNGLAAATLSLSNDNAQLAWNATSSVDVLANDRASAGPLTLLSVGTAGHGQASVVDGKLSYTPAPGFMGVDRVTYTAQASHGGATASAAVNLTVVGRVQALGTAADGLLPDVRVQVKVGAASTEVAASANGGYHLSIEGSDPAAWVVLEATSASRPGLRLRSVLGRLDSVLARGAAEGTLQANRWAALEVGTRSTALDMLATQAHGGMEPTTEADLDNARDWVPPSIWVDLAVDLQLAIARGVALPAGAANTQALQNPQLRLAWLQALRAAFSGADAYRAAYQALWDALPTEAAPPPVPGQTLAYTLEGRGVNTAIVVTYDQGGVANVVSALGNTAADWQVQDGVLLLRLVNPFVIRSAGPEVDATLGRAPQVELRVQRLEVSRLAGWDAVSLGRMRSRMTYLEGQRQGQSVEDTVLPTSSFDLYRTRALDAPDPASAAEFAAGARWAGLLEDGSQGFNVQGLVTLQADGQGRSDTGRLVGLAVSPRGDLEVHDLQNNARMSYQRLGRNSVTGAQLWLMRTDNALRVSPAQVVTLLPLGSSVGFDIGRVWQPQSSVITRRLFTGTAAGTGLAWSLDAQLAPISSALSWAANPVTGQFEIRSAGSATALSWLPLHPAPGGWWVLESVGRNTDLPGAPPPLAMRTLSFQQDLGAARP